MVDQGYILNCSSLSFHKSLVGIMHVDEIETIAKEKTRLSSYPPGRFIPIIRFIIYFAAVFCCFP